jgi:hypothetical protein
MVQRPRRHTFVGLRYRAGADAATAEVKSGSTPSFANMEEGAPDRQLDRDDVPEHVDPVQLPVNDVLHGDLDAQDTGHERDLEAVQIIAWKPIACSSSP